MPTTRTETGRRNSNGTYVYDPDTLRLTAQNGVPFRYDRTAISRARPSATYTYTPENWLATVNRLPETPHISL